MQNKRSKKLPSISSTFDAALHNSRIRAKFVLIIIFDTVSGFTFNLVSAHSKADVPQSRCPQNSTQGNTPVIKVLTYINYVWAYTVYLLRSL